MMIYCHFVSTVRPDIVLLGKTFFVFEDHEITQIIFYHRNYEQKLNKLITSCTVGNTTPYIIFKTIDRLECLRRIFNRITLTKTFFTLCNDITNYSSIIMRNGDRFHFNEWRRIRLP
ncbi:Uncharacterised protein at_DN0449 [Pycnogonum litorale]